VPETTPDHPNLPRRGPLALMFAGIALAGILGGLIGYALVAVSCVDTPILAQRALQETLPAYRPEVGSCEWQLLGGALAGTLVAAVGAAVVAVLMMRAQSEWRGHAPPPRTA